MEPRIPAYLQHNILRYRFGAEGTLWLADLPRQIAELAQAWGLRVGPAFDKDGAVSWVAPVERSDGSEAVLKITFPHDEPRFEAHALRPWTVVALCACSAHPRMVSPCSWSAAV